MDRESLLKTKALLYWYIFGVPACLVILAFVFTTLNIPTLVGFSFLIIVLYAGVIGILVILTNAIISLFEKNK